MLPWYPEHRHTPSPAASPPSPACVTLAKSFEFPPVLGLDILRKFEECIVNVTYENILPRTWLMVCVLFSFLASKDLVQLLKGGIHPAYHSAWHTEAAANRMLINFILHNTKQGKYCSVAAPSEEVLSKHNTPGICSGWEGVGRNVKERLVWIGKFWLFSKNKTLTLASLLLRQLFTASLSVCRVLLRD